MDGHPIRWRSIDDRRRDSGGCDRSDTWGLGRSLGGHCLLRGFRGPVEDPSLVVATHSRRRYPKPRPQTSSLSGAAAALLRERFLRVGRRAFGDDCAHRPSGPSYAQQNAWVDALSLGHAGCVASSYPRPRGYTGDANQSPLFTKGYLAEGEGFEPPGAWRPLRFSRPLRSTAPASLRVGEPQFKARDRPILTTSPYPIDERSREGDHD